MTAPPIKNDGPLVFDLATACKLLESSGLFDRERYRALVNLADDDNVFEHYLTNGWKAGIEPNADFDGSWLFPYYRSAGFYDPPILTFITLRAAGWPTFRTPAEVEEAANVVRISELFDSANYEKCYEGVLGLDPAAHYVIVGERLGYAPSKGFDPVYYLKRYPDLATASLCLLTHYLKSGRAEGRRPISVASGLDFERSGLNPSRQTILLISHQASRTGAPILAYNIAKRLSQRYNVVALVLLPGELIADFQLFCSAVIGPVTSEVDWVKADGVNPVEADYLVDRLLANYSFSYAIVNSIDSRDMLRPLACALVPTVTLVHEFAADSRREGRPNGEMGRILEWTTQIVFSAKAVAESVRLEYPHLSQRPYHILPQGPCDLPPREKAKASQKSNAPLSDLMRPTGSENALIVLGCGTVFMRKGVDLFLACAASVLATQTKRPVRFVWIGRGYDPKKNEYSLYLDQQIERAGLQEDVTILDEVTDLTLAYSEADIFFLSSRLDPLPNVAIDSAMRGLPIVCFEGAGGIAEILAASVETRLGVVPYFNFLEAAKVIVQLANDNASLERLGSAVKNVAQATFNMERYVQSLDELGGNAAQMTQSLAQDLQTLRQDSSFDVCHFLDYGTQVTSRDEAIRLFIARAAALSTSEQPTANFFFRRPCAGFHPQIYAYENCDCYDARLINPLAHFIRSGKPDGSWTHQVIRPKLREELGSPQKLRIALHGHFYYPELFEEFLNKLTLNTTSCHLLLTTDNEAKANILRRGARGYDRGEVIIRVVPNRGRDIGALLTEFGDEIAHKYDLIGHIHSKRSLHVGDRHVGERWREFLWQNLIGDMHPMMDTICDQFERDDGLGLVFPDDPHLSDWDQNRIVAEDLCRKMEILGPLPKYFDFPIGTMFWARSNALLPLLKLKLNWTDYPAEPAPLDGTILHAIERLLPAIAKHSGYHYATTHIPEVTW